MRVAARFVLGAVLLSALLLGVLAYDISQVRRLAALHNDLARIELRATTVSLEQGRLLDELDEYARKLFVTRDPGYGERLDELRRRFEATLSELEALRLAPKVGAEVATLRDLWRALPLGAMTASLLGGALEPEAERLLEDAFREESRRLRRQSLAVTDATQRAVGERVQAALRASRHTRTVTWMVAIVALVATAAVLAWAVSSLRRPLRRLTEGARSVAAGEFSVRLDSAPNDEFAAVETSFNEMARRLAEREEEKRGFVSRLSHDLKTPLVAMQETTRLLLEEIPGPLTANQRRLLGLNQEGSERLGGMISKLLEMTRMEARATRCRAQENDLVELTERVALAFSPRAGRREQRIRVEAPEQPVIASCDRELISQALANLVENALKFSPGESAIVLRVRPSVRASGGGRGGAGARSPALAVIEVADRGPGVPDAEKERIFEKYHQVRGTARGGQGIGLGLAICREIADAHRGAVWVEDHEGGGSVFCLGLPAAAVEAAVPAAGAG